MCTSNFDMPDSWSKGLYRFSAMLLIALNYYLMFVLEEHTLIGLTSLTRNLHKICPPVVVL
jgi:hypothetical protein